MFGDGTVVLLFGLSPRFDVAVSFWAGVGFSLPLAAVGARFGLAAFDFRDFVAFTTFPTGAGAGADTATPALLRDRREIRPVPFSAGDDDSSAVVSSAAGSARVALLSWSI